MVASNSGVKRRPVAGVLNSPRMRTSSLRVCVVTGTYPPARCGIGDYTALLCTALADSGAHVSVITPGYLGAAYREGNPTVLPAVNNWSMRNAARLVRSILGCAPDIVHFQFPTSDYYLFHVL